MGFDDNPKDESFFTDMPEAQELCPCGHPKYQHCRVQSSTLYSVACGAKDCDCLIEKEVS